MYTFMKGKVVVMSNGGGPEVFSRGTQVYNDARALADKEISETEYYILENYGRMSPEYMRFRKKSGQKLR